MVRLLRSKSEDAKEGLLGTRLHFFLKTTEATRGVGVINKRFDYCADTQIITCPLVSLTDNMCYVVLLSSCFFLSFFKDR